MAIGKLGANSASAGTTTVYTAPAGISHVVAHVTLSPDISVTAFGSVILNPGGNVIASVNLVGGGTSTPNASASLMMSPGDSIAVQCGGTGTMYATVTGYEVP